MPGKQSIATALILLALSSVVLADGKMYWRETIPPTIPYQRALILYKDGVQTLILQSKYDIPETKEMSSLGWVVPVPAVPEVASMNARDAWPLFISLGFRSQPLVIDRFALLIILFLGPVGLSLLTLVLCVVSFFVSLPWIKRNRGRLVVYSFVVLLLWFMFAIMMPALSTVKKGGC